MMKSVSRRLQVRVIRAMFSLSVVLIFNAVFMMVANTTQAQEWDRYVLGEPGYNPNTPRKTDNPDGVRLADVNGDGLLDAVTGFEDGNYTRVFLNPGPRDARDLWPTVKVHGDAKGPEDANWVDLNGDGQLDVVTGGSGLNWSIAPKDPKKLLDQASWKSSSTADRRLKGSGMWIEVADFNGDKRPDLVYGSKGRVGIYLNPDKASARSDLSQWKFIDIGASGWTMTIIPFDVNRDGLMDFYITDRKAKNAGSAAISWWENPGRKGQWTRHTVYGEGNVDARFATMADLNGDGHKNLIVSVNEGKSCSLIWFAQDKTGKHVSYKIPLELREVHGVGAANLDRDRPLELVAASTGTLYLLDLRGDPRDGKAWTQTIIQKKMGKADTFRFMDVDQDKDLDILTTSEFKYGVVWFENPHR